MSAYRKIKIFKFSDYESYEKCQESANDYYAELARKNIESTVNLNVDYIAVLLPEKQDISFKVSGKDIVSAINKNVVSESRITDSFTI